MIYLIQSAEVKAAVIANLQCLSFCDAPFYQRIDLFFAPVRLVGGDADIMQRVFLSFQSVYFFADEMCFELPRTPADADARPAIAVWRDA